MKYGLYLNPQFPNDGNHKRRWTGCLPRRE